MVTILIDKKISDEINMGNKGRSEKGLFGEFYTNGKNGKKKAIQECLEAWVIMKADVM